MVKVDFSVVVDGNKLIITPLNGINNNEIYNIKLKDIESADKSRAIEELSFEVITEVKPAYTDLFSVKELLSGIDISERTILYNIREASKYADYVASSSSIDVSSFEVQQFVKYTAAHKSLLTFYINKASKTGEKGQIGDVVFENVVKLTDITNLLKELKQEADFWLNAARGYGLEGRAKPVSTVRGKKANPPMSKLNLTYDRGT